jgi:hypothetical protein
MISLTSGGEPSSESIEEKMIRFLRDPSEKGNILAANQYKNKIKFVYLLTDKC